MHENGRHQVGYNAYCASCGLLMKWKVADENGGRIRVHVCNDLLSCPTEVEQALLTLKSYGYLDPSVEPLGFTGTLMKKP